MKPLAFLVFLCASTAWTQSAPPPAGEKDDTVIATFVEDGGTLTLGEWKGILQVHPEWEKFPREQAIKYYAIVRKAAQLAQQMHLNEKTPYKQILDFQILYNMADFYVQEAGGAITVDHAEIEKYYNDHKEIYKIVRVGGLRVAFTNGAAADTSGVMASKKKPLTEEEAKAKANKLVERIRAGEDFCKLVLLETDDEASKSKCGDMGSWKITDNVPAQMRTSVLDLDQGKVSDPVQQGPAFYIFRASEVTYSPLKEVEDSIFTAVKEQKGEEWTHKFGEDTKVAFPPKKDQDPAPSDPKKQ
jgi:hypothetical protein